MMLIPQISVIWKNSSTKIRHTGTLLRGDIAAVVVDTTTFDAYAVVSCHFILHQRANWNSDASFEIVTSQKYALELKTNN